MASEWLKGKGGKCVICKVGFEGYGNNAEPVHIGRCCDTCNAQFVIPARMRDLK